MLPACAQLKTATHHSTSRTTPWNTKFDWGAELILTLGSSIWVPGTICSDDNTLQRSVRLMTASYQSCRKGSQEQAQAALHLLIRIQTLSSLACITAAGSDLMVHLAASPRHRSASLASCQSKCKDALSAPGSVQRSVPSS